MLPYDIKQKELQEQFVAGAPHDIAIRAASNRTYKTKKPVSERAKAYMLAHPDIYALFCRFTWEAIGSGRTRIGAKLIAERIRWESLLAGNDGFKYNNSYVSAMARRFMQENPEHEGLFETRQKAGA